MLSLNKKQRDELEKFHLEILKNIQSLPTANVIVHLLLGALIESRDRKETVGLFCAIVTSENPTLQPFLKIQYVLQHDGSFFKQIYEFVEKYDFPPPNEIAHLSKKQWKILVKKTTRCHWTEQLQREAGEKSPLERCHSDILQFGILSSQIEWTLCEQSSKCAF